MEISTGAPEVHPNVLALDPSATPGVQAPGQAAAAGQQQGGVFMPTYADQVAAGEAAAAAAMSAGMSAENDRRGGYHDDILPLAAEYGDAMNLPPVPEDASGSATPASGGYLYGSGQGDQPGRGD